MIGAVIAASSAMAESVSPEHQRVLDVSAEVFVAALTCPALRRDHVAKDRFESGFEATGATDDYFVMRYEIETTRAKATRTSEYCATAWYRFGDNGSVVSGLLWRLPNIADQPPLTPEQERAIRHYVITSRYEVCQDIRDDLDARFALVDAAGVPYGIGRATRAGAYSNEIAAKIIEESSASAKADLDAYCADGWARYGPEGTDARGLLVRSE